MQIELAGHAFAGSYQRVEFAQPLFELAIRLEQLRGDLFGDLARPVLLEHALNGKDQLVRVKGFDQIILHAQAQCFDCQRFRSLCRDQDHRRVHAFVLQIAQDRERVAVGQLVIRHDQFRVEVSCQGITFFTGSRREHIVARQPKYIIR